MFQILATFSGTDKLKTLTGTSVTDKASVADLRVQPAATSGIGDLTIDQMTAYYTQYGKINSNGNYLLIGSTGLIGKYQFNYSDLVTRGYVKRNCTASSQLANPNLWTGKDGVDSISVFLDSASVQEQIIEQLTNSNYTAMVKNGAITADLTLADAAGMLSVASILGPAGAKNWRGSTNVAQTNNALGDQYFQSGRFAILVLAPLMPTVNQG